MNLVTSELDITERLRVLRESLLSLQPNLSRIAIALYSEETGLLSTYAYSSEESSPLIHYDVQLEDVPTLEAIGISRQPRLVKDMRQISDHSGEHTQTLINAGYLSSYTVPVHQGNLLLGFIFFNASESDAFNSFVLPHLDTVAFAISLLIINKQAAIKTLQATMKSAIEVTHERNPETGEHLKRIAAYTRLTARTLAKTHPILTDIYIDNLVLFASLHDIGKISIPDAILLKPGALTEEEFSLMKEHTSKGRVLIDTLIKNHALESLEYIDVLRNIVELHHEFWDGNGYPKGIKELDIPLEARIIAVCDVFDALSSLRPYKGRMSSEKAFDILRSMSGKKLDPQCVDAFLDNAEQVKQIRTRFESISE